MKGPIYGLVTILMFLPLKGFGAETASPGGTEWTLKRDRDGVQVYTRKVPGSPYAAVRSTMFLYGVRLSSMVALIMDAEACPEWADRCADSRIHEQLSDTEFLVYTDNNLPFPVKDRDVLSIERWFQDPRTLEVVMNSEAANGILEKTQGRIRITEADLSWKFLPLDSGTVWVINEAHIDPGSPLPAWLTNMLLVETPFNTLKAFREEVLKPKYRDAAIGFVREPME